MKRALRARVLALGGGSPRPASRPRAPPRSLPPPSLPRRPPHAAVAAEDAGRASRMRRIDLGVHGVETDTNSSKFLEYRDVPDGAVPPVRPLRRRRARFRYDVTARTCCRRTRATGCGRHGTFRVEALVRQDPAPLRQRRRARCSGHRAAACCRSATTLQRAFQTRHRAAVRAQPGRRQLRVPERPRVAIAGRRRHRRPRSSSVSAGQVELRLTRDKPSTSG